MLSSPSTFWLYEQTMVESKQLGHMWSLRWYFGGTGKYTALIDCVFFLCYRATWKLFRTKFASILILIHDKLVWCFSLGEADHLLLWASILIIDLAFKSPRTIHVFIAHIFIRVIICFIFLVLKSWLLVIYGKSRHPVLNYLHSSSANGVLMVSPLLVR